MELRHFSLVILKESQPFSKQMTKIIVCLVWLALSPPLASPPASLGVLSTSPVGAPLLSLGPLGAAAVLSPPLAAPQASLGVLSAWPVGAPMLSLAPLGAAAVVSYGGLSDTSGSPTGVCSSRLGSCARGRRPRR